MRSEDLLFNAATVIANGYFVQTSVFIADLNAICACVQSVFEKFFHDGSRSFHDFAGGDLIINGTVESINLPYFTLLVRSARMENA